MLVALALIVGLIDGRINSTAPKAAATQPKTVTIDAVGDVMLGWRVSTLVETQGADTPFAGVRGILAHADAVVGNLECPLSDRGAPTKSKSKKQLKERKEFVLRATPDSAAGLARAGFAAMTLANNHILDYGPAALDDTLAALHDNGIATAGAGEDVEEAWTPAFFERRGVRFAMIGVSEVIPKGYGALLHAPGVAPGRDPSTGTVSSDYLRGLARAIRLARSEADVVIVYEHWGTELASAPTPEHVRLAHAAIDAGATLVLGAHPHVLGPVEEYHHGLIAYTLGNFVFDTQPGIQTKSAILQISLRGDKVAVWKAVPVVLRAGLPGPAQAADAAEIGRLVAGTEAVQPPVVAAAPASSRNGPPQPSGR